jgi:5'-methylthioadenosine phosphorylase
MIGFIGGSGVYDALPLVDTREADVTTPYGDPSATVTVGRLEGTDRELAFLPRHGRDHEHSPTDLPYRANLYALKELGVERVLASNAVGSLRDDLPPRTLVVPDDLFDRTRHRAYSFFGDGVVVHASLAEPFCPHTSAHLAECAGAATNAAVERGGTYVCIEGPQFSTRAESAFFRSNGWDVVGMTAVPEAKLAREAELCYATVAGVTDYDVWKEGGEVTLQEVLEHAAANEAAIKETVERAVRTMPDERECDCASAVANAVNTPAGAIPDERRREVQLLIGDYLDG